MASFEGGRFCSTDEYRKHIDGRHPPEQITADQDYTVMVLASRPRQAGGEAAAIPVRFQTYPEAYHRDRGIWIVKFAFLDEDCEPLPSLQALYLESDGMIALTKEFRRSNPLVSEGYVKSYDDGFDDDLWNLLESKDLVLSH